MIKKVFLLGFAYLIVGVVSFTSCITAYDAYICDINFNAIDSYYSEGSEAPETFEDRVGFAINSTAHGSTCYSPRFEIFSSAHATSTCADFKNELVKASYKLSLDRPIVLDTDTIFAETDLFGFPETNSLIEVTIQEECDFVRSTIILSPSLVERIHFEPGEYQVKFECSTSDSRTFVKTRRVIFSD